MGQYQIFDREPLFEHYNHPYILEHSVFVFLYCLFMRILLFVWIAILICKYYETRVLRRSKHFIRWHSNKFNGAPAARYS